MRFLNRSQGYYGYVAFPENANFPGHVKTNCFFLRKKTRSFGIRIAFQENV